MKKISVRLWAWMLCLVFLTIGLLWLFQVRFLSSFYLEKQTTNIVRHGKELSKLLLESNDVKKINLKLEDLNLKFNASIDIYTETGTLKYSSDTYAQLMLGINKAALIKETLKEGEVLKIVTHSQLGYKELLTGIRIMDDKGIAHGVILLMAPLAPVEEAVDIIKEQLLYITFVLIGLSFILSYFFARAFTKPILAIKKGADEMAKGNLDIQFLGKEEDELGDLAHTMNHLVGELKKIDQIRKDLIANVSHEFRTPLSLIHGYAETIRDVTGENPEKREKQLNIVMEESERLSEMVSDMLDYSGLQSNTTEFKFERIDLKEALLSIVNRFEYYKQKTKIDLVAQVPEELCMVMADEKRMNQVFYNLINNAFVHSGSELPIYVRVIRVEECIRVEVQNSGKVIPAEELEFIWERFHKVDRQRNTGGGSGLGLAIVKSILEAHESAYGVTSDEKDGTIFWFSLKMA